MLYESLFEIVKYRSASIVFQRWLRKFGFQHLIFLILLRFWAGFCNILNFSFWSFFELEIFKNDAQALQNDSQNASGSILKPFEKHHFSSFWWKFSHSCGVLCDAISGTFRNDRGVLRLSRPQSNIIVAISSSSDQFNAQTFHIYHFCDLMWLNFHMN